MTMRSALMNVMVRAAEKAGKALLRDFGEVEHLQVSKKGPKDFVTNADHKSEKILREELARSRPDFGFLMEESGETGTAGAKERWIVDPLDGTKNFMHGLPLWAINIAAERDGEVVAGLTYLPIGDQLFWAEKGVGAFVNNQRLRVSARGDTMEAMVHMALGMSSGDTATWAVPMQQSIIGAVAGTRRLGSSAISLAYTAAGRFDAAIDSGMGFWDIAAGMLMVREAGGRVTMIDAKDDRPALTLASNYHVHQPLLDLVNGNAKSGLISRQSD